MRLTGKTSSFADYKEISCAVFFVPNPSLEEELRKSIIVEAPVTVEVDSASPKNEASEEETSPFSAIYDFNTIQLKMQQEDENRRRLATIAYDLSILILSTTDTEQSNIDKVKNNFTIFLQTIFVANPLATYRVILKGDSNQAELIEWLQQHSIEHSVITPENSLRKILQDLCFKTDSRSIADVVTSTTQAVTAKTQQHNINLAIQKKRTCLIFAGVIAFHRNNIEMLIALYQAVQDTLDPAKNSCLGFLTQERHWKKRPGQKTATYEKISNEIALALIQAEYNRFKKHALCENGTKKFERTQGILKITRTTHARPPCKIAGCLLTLFGRHKPPAQKWVESIRNTLTTAERTVFDENFLATENTNTSETPGNSIS